MLFITIYDIKYDDYSFVNAHKSCKVSILSAQHVQFLFS